MLTIKSPIKISANPSMVSIDDTFAMRVEANYNVLASSLSPENMLHLITQKQDILMEGDSMTSIVSVDNHINRQQINMELINNVMNRILVADEQKLSYQDRVFIDNVLNRIGITDVKQFMNQVSVLKQSTINVNKLLALYDNKNTEIQQLKQYFKQINIDNSSSQDNKTVEEHSSDMWLHQEILNRLQTGDIYNELESHFRNIQNEEHYIDNGELSISEQYLQAKSITLNNVRNDITSKNTPLEYRVFNSYELGTAEENNTEENNIQNSYIEAVVLNAVKNVYSLRSEKIENNNHVWYGLIQSIQNTAENTLKRFEHMHEHISVTSENVEQYNKQVQTNMQNEIMSLEALHNSYSHSDISNSIVNNDEFSESTMLHAENINNLEEIQTSDVQEQISNIKNIISENNISEILIKQYAQEVHNAFVENENILVQNIEQYSQQVNKENQNIQNNSSTAIENVHQSVTNGLLALTQINNQYAAMWENISTQYNIAEDNAFIYATGDEQNISSNEEKVENRTYIENNINSAMTQITQLHNSFSNSLSSMSEKYQENIKNISLRYADNEEVRNTEISNVIEEYQSNVSQLINNELNRLSEINSAYLAQYRNELSSQNVQIKKVNEENKHYSSQINYLTKEEEQLKNQLNQVEQTNVFNNRQINQVMENNKAKSPLQINRARAMAEARKVLESPEAVKLEYMNIQNEIVNNTQENNVTEKKIDENVMKIFEQIALYQNNPQASHPNISTSSAALDMLMRDTQRPVTPREELIEDRTIEKTEKLIHDVRQQEIRQQLEKIINVEVPEISYIRQPENIELLHKAVETGINEDVLEELRNVQRNVNKNTEIHTDEVKENDYITRTVTNRVNNIELQQNDELTNIIANNVQNQLNSITEKVYRKLEKRMDSEKRRRGL